MSFAAMVSDPNANRQLAFPHLLTHFDSAVTIPPLRQRTEDLPAYCHGGAERSLTALESIERDMIVAALNAEDGNRVRAAAVLGIARSSLYRKLTGFGISIS